MAAGHPSECDARADQHDLRGNIVAPGEHGQPALRIVQACRNGTQARPRQQHGGLVDHTFDASLIDPDR
jgi:hypothetical protein